MPLFEVDRKYLKNQSEGQTYRFIHDPLNRISIHIWQKEGETQDEGSGEITRFQVAMENDILEWKNSRVLYGKVDSGDEGFGIKKSPIMMMTENVNQAFIKKIVPVLKENEEIAGMKFLIRIIEKSS